MLLTDDMGWSGVGWGNNKRQRQIVAIHSCLAGALDQFQSWLSSSADQQATQQTRAVVLLKKKEL